MLEKLKSLLANDAVFMAILLVLVAVVSFGLGRQSVVANGTFSLNTHSDQFESQSGVLLTKTPLPVSDISTSTKEAEARVLGSRTGTKYHLPSCPGAAQIKDENKVFFDSIALAKAAGYSPAANCPGLQ